MLMVDELPGREGVTVSAKTRNLGWSPIPPAFIDPPDNFAFLERVSSRHPPLVKVAIRKANLPAIMVLKIPRMNEFSSSIVLIR
jgi:hypothetical protein